MQVTKAEKRADGWYYMLHYTVRGRNRRARPPLAASTEACQMALLMPQCATYGWRSWSRERCRLVGVAARLEGWTK